jgi:hypothetical protein
MGVPWVFVRRSPVQLSFLQRGWQAPRAVKSVLRQKGRLRARLRAVVLQLLDLEWRLANLPRASSVVMHRRWYASSMKETGG